MITDGHTSAIRVYDCMYRIGNFTHNDKDNKYVCITDNFSEVVRASYCLYPRWRRYAPDLGLLTACRLRRLSNKHTIGYYLKNIIFVADTTYRDISEKKRYAYLLV